MLTFTPTRQVIKPGNVGRSAVLPASVQVVLKNGQYTSEYQAARTPQNAGKELPVIAAQNYPVYEFIFYNREPCCQVNRVGTIQTISDPASNKREMELINKENHVVKIIGGIIDGPILFPLANYVGYKGTESEFDAGSLTYGTDSSQEKGRSEKRTTKYGLDAEEKFTEGVGPSFSISFKTGMGSVQENSTEIHLVKKISQQAPISFSDDDRDKPIADEHGSIKVLSAMTVVTAYNYIDNYGQSINSTKSDPTNGFKAASLEMGSGSFLLFKVYDVTPRRLETYTPEVINTKMQALGYEGENYFKDVMCANALPLDDKNYLPAQWSTSAKAFDGIESTTISYTESSWTLDADLKVGISGGGGFGIFGDGEEMEFSVMAGGEMSRETTMSTKTGMKWSIELEPTWGPRTGDAPGRVENYSFRIYFLPVPHPPSKLAPTY